MQSLIYNDLHSSMRHLATVCDCSVVTGQWEARCCPHFCTGPLLKIMSVARRSGAWPPPCYNPSMGNIAARKSRNLPWVGGTARWALAGHISRSPSLANFWDRLICGFGGEQIRKAPSMCAGRAVYVAARRNLVMITWNPVLFGQSQADVLLCPGSSWTGSGILGESERSSWGWQGGDWAGFSKSMWLSKHLAVQSKTSSSDMLWAINNELCQHV